MIIVDTSVVVDFLRTADPKLLTLFRVHAAAICGITRAEVLHGARDSRELPKLVASLDSFGQLPMSYALWDQVGVNLNELRRAGVTVPLADVIVCTLGIDRDVEVWSRDAQFKLVQGVIPKLRLFPEPP